MIDLTGQKFGRLFVIRSAGSDKRGEARWSCVCECGNEKIVLGSHLRSGRTRSCGCYARETTSARIRATPLQGNLKHGYTKTRLYQIWSNMKTRCLNPNTRAFKWYGAVGVTICPDWLNFDSFKSWALASGYRDDLTIERINPFENYCPENCTWIPISDQRKNQRRSKQWQ